MDVLSDLMNIIKDIAKNSNEICEIRSDGKVIDKAKMHNITEIDESKYSDINGDYQIQILRDEPYLSIDKDLLNGKFFEKSFLSLNKCSIERIKDIVKRLKEVKMLSLDFRYYSDLKSINRECNLPTISSSVYRKELNIKIAKNEFDRCFIELSDILTKARYEQSNKDIDDNERLYKAIESNKELLSKIDW